MAQAPYMAFLAPKWPVLLIASVLAMLHLDYCPKISSYNARTLYKEYDYIIVGGGTAGCVLANRLSADGSRTVLLIEAGGVENAATEIPLLSMLHFHGPFDWDYRTEPQKYACLGMDDNRCNWARGKVLGGSSSTNFLMHVRGNRRDFDLWEIQHGAFNWSYKSVLPYFMKSENYMGPNPDRRYRGNSGKVPVTFTVTQTQLVSTFLEAGRVLGYNLIDYNGPEQAGFSRTQTTSFEGRRFSAAKSYIRPIYKKRSKNLHLFLQSRATKVIFKNKRAVGVHFVKGGILRKARARREVILSAGVIGSTQLLLLSGVGPARDLEKLGIPVVADLPVGENLQDHLFMGGMAATMDVDAGLKPQDMEVVREYARTKTGALTLPAAMEAVGFMNTSFAPYDYPDIEVVLNSVSAANIEAERFLLDLGLRREIYDEYYKPYRGRNAFQLAPLLNRLKSRGVIKLRSNNYRDPPILDPRYYSHPADIEIAAEAMLQCIRILSTKPFADLGTKLWGIPFPPCKGYTTWSRDYLKCMARYLSHTGWHQCCTNPMGSGPNAVVDPRLRVRGGVKRLRVVDASVMPDIVSANLNAAVYMIAEKAADIIREDNP
nr:4-pyridoxate dehydrogenase-like [Dermacentor andersoni]